MSLPSDEAGTPPWLMEFIHRRWGVPDLDVAASDAEGFHQAERYYTRENDALAPGRSWECELGFCNPPYSQKGKNGERDYLKDFTARAREAVERGEARQGFVLVAPDTEATGWWRRNVIRGARPIAPREPIEVAPGLWGWIEVYEEGPIRIEAVTGLGRVSFTLPGREGYATGKADTAVVALRRLWEPLQARPEPFYERERVRLYHGDARRLLPLLAAEKERTVVVTDPVWPNAPEGMFPVQAPADLLRQVAAYWPKLARRAVVQLGCNSDPRFLQGVPPELPFVRACWLRYSWPSARGTVLNSGDGAYVFGSHEPRDPPAEERHHNFRGVLPGECTSSGRNRRGRHPCPRDLEHVRWLVSTFTRTGDRVVDPFAGSGTTLRAAWEHGREAVGVELEERWCEQAARQLEQAAAQGRLFG